MKHISFPKFRSALMNTIAAAAVTLIATPAAFADTYSGGLAMLLADPTNFVAISEGAPGHVTFASMSGDKLAVQFLIPNHAGDTFGEIVGEIDENGVFHGNSMLIGERGQGEASPVTMIFHDDGTIVANIEDDLEGSGFMVAEKYSQY